MSPNPTLPYLYLFSKQKFFSKSVLLKILGNCLLSASELTSLCQMLVPKKYQAFVSCSVSVMATESFQPLSVGIVGECIQKSFFLVFRSARTFYATFSGPVRPFVCPPAKFSSPPSFARFFSLDRPIPSTVPLLPPLLVRHHT